MYIEILRTLRANLLTGFLAIVFIKIVSHVHNSPAYIVSIYMKVGERAQLKRIYNIKKMLC